MEVLGHLTQSQVHLYFMLAVEEVVAVLVLVNLLVQEELAEVEMLEIVLQDQQEHQEQLILEAEVVELMIEMVAQAVKELLLYDTNFSN
jgi:Flp pilus assembly protein protease CpaA